ncbi:sugar ABC transporter permease [Candidatus Atribacteria bacterium RBG_19FT_COMBO_35_14]|uniref:Xylose transport system permease protein XylH n=1 Tax=Candidatus Sediminicultor quintus TaxID=1797291 RepID=A0A1F5A9M9_9BACT|nr:MAG: sugar ABC transporter permease [Candidatus Atribacteria bacterium RBG_19FT_COMBO_35_14]
MKQLNFIDKIKKIKIDIRAYTLIFALIVIWLLFGSLTGGVFLSSRNFSNLLRQMTIISFLAIGMTPVIITGNIDLSVGSMTGFISVIAAYLQAILLPTFLPGLFPALSVELLGIFSTIITIIICLLLGLLIGMGQGYIIAYGGVPAFIVTLGGMLILRGGLLAVAQGKTIVPIEDSLRVMAQGYLTKYPGIIIAVIAIIILFLVTLQSRTKKTQYGLKIKPLSYDLVVTSLFSAIVLGFVLVMNSYRGVQIPVLIMAIIAVMVTYLTNNTRFGRHIYAVGGNKEATKLSGINVQAVVLKTYALMGLLCGVSGIILTGYVAAGTTSGGMNYELSAIGGCVMGGTSLMGGIGTVFGALMGTLLMTSIENGMSVMNMSVFWQYIVKGLILVLAVYVDVTSRKNKSL